MSPNPSRRTLKKNPQEEPPTSPSVDEAFCLRGGEDDADPAESEILDAEVIDERPAPDTTPGDGYTEPPGFGVALVVSERPTAEPSSTELVTLDVPSQAVTTRKRKQYPPEFEAFWEAFPRERRAAKAQCAAKFARAVRDGTLAAVIIQAAHRYRDDPNREPAYTAAPLTWLNQARWESGPLPPRHHANAGGDAFRALIGQPDTRPQPVPHLTGVPF